MDRNTDINIAVVGATGMVGRETLSCLADRQFPLARVRAFSSKRSAGSSVDYGDEEIRVEELKDGALRGVDIAFFCAGSEVSQKFAPQAVEHGTIVIDKASCFRMHAEVPLVVPEVNSELLRRVLAQAPRSKGVIIASPNCSTIPLTVVLKPLLDSVGVKRVVVSTYQSVSGAGQAGMDELWNQTLAIFQQKDLEIKKFPHQIAFNCIPHIDSFLPTGYTKEEMKVIDECRKILEKPDLRITATAVRVPTFICHAESVNIETERAVSADQARQLLAKSPGIILADDPDEKVYPHGIKSGGTDATYVGRIREDSSVDHGLNLWIVADNLRKGAALNAVQIADVVIGSDRFRAPIQ